jgi:signal recognition particle subunit SRP54
MFNVLTSQLQKVFSELRRKGALRPEDVDEALRQVRLSLLDADVHFQVVKDILGRVREKSLGEHVSRALNPAQQVIKILHGELVTALGEPQQLNLKGTLPRAVLLVGLQGSGKTTTTAKLAARLTQEGERVWMVATDTYRPAAVDQLVKLGESLDLRVYHQTEAAPEQIASRALDAARAAGATVVLLDTAGRSQLDRRMMEEIQQIHEAVDPVEVLLVADAMTGQQALNIATGFGEAVKLTGLILTKMDGDARGGAAISMRAVTGVPIKFIGTGEKLDAIERFIPDRLASRILGMGDIMTLIEQAEEKFDQGIAEKQVERIVSGEFTFEDFAAQLTQIQKLGPLGKIVELLPGNPLGSIATEDLEVAQTQLRRTEAIINSMTVRERRKPDLLNASRKRRIAAGSGTSVQEINQLIRQYRQMRRVFKKVGKKGMGGLPF